MLREEQVAELLIRVEKVVGKELPQIRGNLRNPENRAAAVWELLVMEAASYIGQIEYEPEAGESPDIRLHPPKGRKIWIEAAYLYPRFWREEQRSEHVKQWLYKEAERRGIPFSKIHPRLDGKDSNAGPVLTLPAITKRKQFLKEPEIVKLFRDIASKPAERHSCRLSRYTVSVSYSPSVQGPYGFSSGLQQESPKIVEEHAVYRVLNEKAGKQKVPGPKIICIGSDQSPALSILNAPGRPTYRDGIRAALEKNRSISAVIIISIRTSAGGFGMPETRAHGDLFLNDYADTPLTKEETELILKMDFNRWKYTFPLRKWGNSGAAGFHPVVGTLTYKWRGNGMEIEIPARIIVESLAGKTNIFKEYRLSETDTIFRAFNEGWVVESFTLKEGNIEAGEGPKIVLTLSPPLLQGLIAKKEK
jgi:hypothetical protein